MSIIAEQWQVAEGVQLDVHLATGLRRLTGLIGRGQLAQGRALHFARCRSVHSLGMRLPIDVVFLSGSGEVLATNTLVPWRFANCSKATQVLELRAGEAARLGLRRGVQLTGPTHKRSER